MSSSPARKDSTMIQLIAVPFDGMGRSGAQANAPAALRAAGLVEALGARLADHIVLDLPEPTPFRSGPANLLNEVAVAAMVSQVAAQVTSALRQDRFPVIYGGDCAVLLAAIPALESAVGSAGLVFMDGHEDATPLELSTSGEVANMEIAILLGRTGGGLEEPLRAAVGVLDPSRLAVLGPRDADYRDPLGVASISGSVWLRTGAELAADPGHAATQAAEHVLAAADNWWLHVDVDVLAKAVFGSYGAPGEPDLDGGLTWAQLTSAVRSLLRHPGCRGCSLAVFNPDLDHDGSDARSLVDLVSLIADCLPPR